MKASTQFLVKFLTSAKDGLWEVWCDICIPITIAIRILAGSALLSGAIKLLTVPFIAFLQIWWEGPSSDKFSAWINGTGYWHITGVLFIVAFALWFLTDKIKIFPAGRHSASVKVDRT